MAEAEGGLESWLGKYPRPSLLGAGNLPLPSPRLPHRFAVAPPAARAKKPPRPEHPLALLIFGCIYDFKGARLTP